MFKEDSHVRVRLRTSSQTRWLPHTPALTVCEQLLLRSCPPEAVVFAQRAGIKQPHMLTGSQDGSGYCTAREMAHAL